MDRRSPQSKVAAQEPAQTEDPFHVRARLASDQRATKPSKIADRYLVHELLGRGGMASVYRVTDVSSGRELAIKQLTSSAGAHDQGAAIGLFEREYHTLAQLTHPRVIAVYDYGVDESGPYYTMELLDGGDIKDRCPVPWRTACALLFDACSSLALLHSRGFVHRDVSPRNVRCTKEGHAKLIDFGAMAPMGRSSQIVGTPAFVAPEVVHRLALDGRTDLFSLGATLYYALTGQAPYPGRDFAQVIESWHHKPFPPSSFSPEVPSALDALVLSLVSIDPALRPRTAFEVMQRLEAVAGLEPAEPLSVSHAYLSTPTLVGRSAVLATIASRISRSLNGEGGAVLVEGAAGAGRSRLLDACVLDAKTLGACVLRTSADAAGNGALPIAWSLVEQLREMLPELSRASAQSYPSLASMFDASAAGTRRAPGLGATAAARAELQNALCQLLLHVAKQRPLVLAIDDVHRVDDASTALLAALVRGASESPLSMVMSAERIALETPSPALELIASGCASFALEPLDLEQTTELLASVFGDVPNLQLLSARIQAVAHGNPRESMDLVRHLVDQSRIAYDRGSWTLPAELAASDLPDSAEDALRQRLAKLTPLARFLIEAHALASHDVFAPEDYYALQESASLKQVDCAIDELLAQRVLVTEGQFYSLTHRASAHTLIDRLDQAACEDRHCALARLYAHKSASPLISVKHLFAAGLSERGLDQLTQFLSGMDDTQPLVETAQLNVAEICWLLARGLEVAQELRRRPREIADLRHWLVMLTAAADDAFYWLAAPAWLEQLKRDSGLAFWQAAGEVEDKTERLTRAFVHATEQHAATAEAERVYRPDEAIKLLVRYVALSLAIGARVYDARLLASLPPLLEPFAPLSPLIDAIWQNAIATYDAACRCRFERARSRWIDVFTKFPSVTGSDLQYVAFIRNALAYGIGTLEARLGLESSTGWVEFLDQDRLQAVNAIYLRRIVRLQYGDLEVAERYRKQAELLAVQAVMPQMFWSVLSVELVTHAMANNLTGVKQVRDRIAPLAARYPGWVAYGHLAEAHFQRLRGSLDAARAAFEASIAVSAPDAADPDRAILAWPSATAGYVEVLVDLDRAPEARSCGERALAICFEQGIDIAAHGIARSLALAESKLGDHRLAIERLQNVIDEQLALGVTGLQLGASYEARTRIAIWAGDEPGIERYAHLTAAEYRHGVGSALAGRYERLMDDAQRAGARALPSLSDFQSTALLTGARSRHTSAQALVAREMRSAESARERAACAVRLLCESQGARAGHLYLRSSRGIRLAASHGLSNLPEGLDQFISEYFTRETQSDDTATALATDSSLSSMGTTHGWTGVQGVMVRPVLISCIVDGVAQHAGVAALITDRRDMIAGGAQLAAAIGAHLFRVGDVHQLLSGA